MWKQLISVFFLVISTSNCDEVKSELKRSFAKTCDTSYTLTCLKLDIVSWVDRLNEDDDYSILPGVSLVRENSSESVNTADLVSNLAREFPNDPEARLDVFLMKKVTGFINSHSIKLKLWNENVESATGRKGGGGGFGGGKGGGGLGYLLAAGMMMKGTLMALAMGGLAAMAGKALMAALMSLMLSAIAGLKGSGGGGKTTYEVVAKPVYTSSHSHSTAHEDYGGHGHSGYGRSFAEQPLPLGLQPGYKPNH